MTREPGRNERCPCGSGRKYKNCCIGQVRRREPPGSVRRFFVDVVDRVVGLERLDGSVVRSPWSGPAVGAFTEMSRFTFDPRSGELQLTFADGRVAVAELGNGGVTELPAAGRRVVYLDQLHWITLARLHWAPEKLNARERRAAESLTEMAHDKSIALPISAAHMSETVPIDGHRRRDLAATLMNLSRGWIMRHPFRVQQEEILAAWQGREPRATRVITLEPWDLLHHEILARDLREDDDIPGSEGLVQRMSAAASIYALLIENERMDVTGDRMIATHWAASHEVGARLLAAAGASRADVAAAARTTILQEIEPEIERAADCAGVAAAELRAWLCGPGAEHVRAMPYVGRLEQIFLHRLKNADERWERNDLNDMLFLACAAGYADVVVGERKMSSYLLRADKVVEPGAFVCRTLEEAVEFCR